MTVSPEPSASESVSAQQASRRLNHVLLVSAILTVLVLIAYWPVHGYDFVNYDDEAGILETPAIRTGLAWENVKWAFTHIHMGNWQPITNLSHMLDCQLFGLHAGPAHVENVLIHCVNTALVFLVLLGALRGEIPTSNIQQPKKFQSPNLKSQTGNSLDGLPAALNHFSSVWPSAFVAALFGLHPLHVESVAWISERKDVLSTLFFLLTLIAYVRYAKEKRLNRLNELNEEKKAIPQNLIFYLLALATFALGLMSKPMLVTLPLVLLLIDFWPLKRIDRTRVWQIVGEKVPFLILAIGASLVAFLSQAHSRAIETVSYLPIGSRIENSLVSYFRYMEKMFWPTGLIAFYPRVPVWPWWQVAGAFVSLAGITFLVIRSALSRPYLAVGWFWYAITLLPVIGLVQIGAQSVADRYTYIPLIGLFIVLCWGIADLVAHLQIPQVVTATMGTVCALVCLVLTQSQVRHWENSAALFRHMIAVMPNNALAHNNLGSALYSVGRSEDAIKEFETALQISPGYDDANNNLGIAEFRRGDHQKAVDHLEAVLRKGPNLKALFNLAVVLVSEGDLPRAAQYYQAALQLKPDSAEAHYGLGDVLAARGKIDEAIPHFEAAIHTAPQLAEPRNALARALVRKGDLEKAMATFGEALRVDPLSAEAHNGIAGILEQAGNPQEALQHYEAAVKLQPDLADAQNNLASLLLRQGRADEGLAHSLEAIRLKPNSAESHYNAGNALLLQKKFADAEKYYLDALQLKTNYAEAHQNLAVVLEKLSRDKEAVEQYEALVRLRPGYAAAFSHLAQAQARIGDFTNAIASAEQGVRLSMAAGQNELAAQMKDNLVRYRAGKP